MQISTWKDFKEKFKTLFRPSIGSSSVDHLMNIVQLGSVDEYRDRFEELSVELPHVSVDVLESAFLRGLKKNFRDQVVRCRPADLDDIVEIESQEKDNTSYHVRSFSRHHQPQSGGMSAGNGKTHEYSQFKKPYEVAKDFQKPRGAAEV